MVIAQDVDDMEYLSRKPIEYGKWGLDVNIAKTVEYMCIGDSKKTYARAMGQTIKHAICTNISE